MDRDTAKTNFDADEEGESDRVDRNGPIAGIVPVSPESPDWKKPPLARLSLAELRLGDEVVADRDAGR